MGTFHCIHHFYKDHNAPCLPPKLWITIVLDFSWDDCNTQENLETMVMQDSGKWGWGRGGGGVNRVHCGLCESK